MTLKTDLLPSFEHLIHLQQEAEGKFAEYQQSLHKFQNALIKKLSDLSSESTGIEPVVKRGPGRPPKPKTSEPVVKRGPGRPPKSQTTVPSVLDQNLGRAIWDTLGKGSLYHRKHVPDYPAGAIGLKISELKQLLEKEHESFSGIDNLGVSLQNILYRFLELKKISRNDDRRYCIVRGAQFDD